MCEALNRAGEGRALRVGLLACKRHAHGSLLLPLGIIFWPWKSSLSSMSTVSGAKTSGEKTMLNMWISKLYKECTGISLKSPIR